MDSWRQRTTKVSCRQLSGAFDPRTLKLLHKIAAWPRQHGDYASAEASQRKAYGGMLLALGPAHPVTVRMQINLAEVELHLGRLDEARQLLQTALAQPRLSDSRYDLPRIQSLLGQAAQATGLLGLARHWFGKAKRRRPGPLSSGRSPHAWPCCTSS